MPKSRPRRDFSKTTLYNFYKIMIGSTWFWHAHFNIKHILSSC